METIISKAGYWTFIFEDASGEVHAWEEPFDEDGEPTGAGPYTVTDQETQEEWREIAAANPPTEWDIENINVDGKLIGVVTYYWE